MGIRFTCPNGHKLHVKTYLAGQRGICPDCGTRVQIPTGGGGNASGAGSSDSMVVASAAESVSSILQQAPKARTPGHDNQGPNSKPKRLSSDMPMENALAQPSNSDSIVIKTVPDSTAGTQPVAPPQLPDEPVSIETEQSSTATWHVRSPDGRQFGPADAKTFSRWLLEKRVVPDSYVWCEGWTDWQRAGDIPDQLPGALGNFGNNPNAANTSAPVVDTTADKESMESAAVNALKKSRRRSQRFQITVALLLLIAAIVLLVVLVRVLTYTPPPEAHPGGLIFNEQFVPDSLYHSIS